MSLIGEALSPGWGAMIDAVLDWDQFLTSALVSVLAVLAFGGLLVWPLMEAWSTKRYVWALAIFFLFPAAGVLWIGARRTLLALHVE